MKPWQLYLSENVTFQLKSLSAYWNKSIGGTLAILAAKAQADALAKGKTDIEWGTFKDEVLAQIDEMFRDPKEQA